MLWVVGIDEAGYGPNLGPLVQAAIALRLPKSDPAGWDTLKSVVRRAHEKPDGRVLIDDSKKVYTRGGIEALERGVWAISGAEPTRVHDYFWHGDELPLWGEHLRAEFWFDGDDLLPLHIDAETEWAVSEPLRTALNGNWTGDYRIVPTLRFNQIVDGSGSKATVLSCGLIDLIESVTAAIPDDGEPLLILCDKQGGRNFYSAIVQASLPTGWVVTEREGAAESRYRVENLSRPITVVFRPRADGDSVAVALASMLCKYLRELCMRQFNRFWAARVPGLAPTAGYPVDAKRFYAAIRPTMARLGLTADQVWRKK
ncbi:hypothetical protein R5W23_002184 [Gemmata sp. JC673]|uniref:Uncharacterized protein n=1 Tax=Gemmata algarum TaxID=2975278 RepID=A0ABU5F048_9BACT|nr:hypothetical protein [Gemmata algarum]MDY3560935.1 hypothetical protein [Gemmata algarum]